MEIVHQDRVKLAQALTRRAIDSTDMNKEAALRLRTRMAFADELIRIDPNLEKLAWSLPSLSDIGSAISSGVKSIGSGIARGAKGAWNYVKENPLEAALTATMFIPGLNVVGGLARAGMMAGRAGMAANRAYRGAQAAKAFAGATRAQKALTGVKNVAGGLRAGASRAKTVFGRAPTNPINNQIGLMGMRGTSMTGRALGEGAKGFLRGPGMSAAARSQNAWRNLSRGGKALRTAGVGLAATDVAGVGNFAHNVAKSPQMKQALNAGNQGMAGGARQTGSARKFQAVQRGVSN